MKLLTTTLTLFALTAFSGALDAAVLFDPGKTLEIELTTRRSLSIDELHYFTLGTERTFEKRKYPGPFEVDFYSGASQSDEGPLIDVQLIRWGLWTPADFECRIYVTATSGGEDYDLGVFVGRTDSFAPTSLQQEERLVASAAEAMDKVYDRLIKEGLIKAPAE